MVLMSLSRQKIIVGGIPLTREKGRREGAENEVGGEGRRKKGERERRRGERGRRREKERREKERRRE